MELYVFGPDFGLPDPSPFCMKALVLLEMSGRPYRTARCDPRKAPKGKGPYLVDGSETIPDSTFIRWHLEKRYAVDFDAGLTGEQRASAWAFEKLCEDHLYWALVHERWTIDSNFDRGPRRFFAGVPAPLRPLVIRLIRGRVSRDLHGQGFGRHRRDEVVQLGKRAIDALADFLGSKPFLMGEQPCGADAAVFSMVAGVLCEGFDTPLLEHAQARCELVAYRDRGLGRWFPDFKA